MNGIIMAIEQLSWQWELLVRILIACILGILIGFERRNRNKIAGVRTHAVVAFGAALMMIVSKYGFLDINNFDGARIAAQIVSGIGFLGAGIIVVRNNNSVSGLTTAAGLWATAGIGMSIGAGQYFIAVMSGGLLILMQILLHNIGLFADEPYSSKIKLQLKGSMEGVYLIEEYISEENIGIASIKLSKNNEESTKLELELLFPAKYDKISLIEKLAEEKYVIFAAG